MPRVWSHTKSAEGGFSVVEVLLAAVVCGFVVTAVIGSYVYGHNSTAESGENSRAVMLAEEGIEAVKNIRDASYGNLTDGTYGLAQSANTWILSGTSDTTGIFTRQVTISTIDSNRKNVSVQVSSSGNTFSTQAVVATRFTNWQGTLVKSWATPLLSGSYAPATTNDAVKVATQGNYAYVVLSGATQDFLVINTSNPAIPTLVGSLAMAGTLTNIAVSGNYAYVSGTDDSNEMMVVNISNPASPVLTSAFNAAGAADGRGIFVSGTNAYLVRAANAANNEFVKISIAIPTVPTRLSYYNLNVNMNEVYVNGNDIFIVTSSDTAEVIKISSLLAGLITTVSNLNLPGTTDALTITGSGQYLAVGQGTIMYTIDGGIFSTTAGSVTLPGTINDLSNDPATGYVFAGTSATAAEFQIVNASNIANLTILGSADIAGTTSALNGVAYNSTLDIVAGASASDTQEVITFIKN